MGPVSPPSRQFGLRLVLCCARDVFAAGPGESQHRRMLTAPRLFSRTTRAFDCLDLKCITGTLISFSAHQSKARTLADGIKAKRLIRSPQKLRNWSLCHINCQTTQLLTLLALLTVSAGLHDAYFERNGSLLFAEFFVRKERSPNRDRCKESYCLVPHLSRGKDSSVYCLGLHLRTARNCSGGSTILTRRFTQSTQQDRFNIDVNCCSVGRFIRR